jgi:hypothetical protein
MKIENCLAIILFLFVICSNEILHRMKSADAVYTFLLLNYEK